MRYAKCDEILIGVSLAGMLVSTVRVAVDDEVSMAIGDGGGLTNSVFYDVGIAEEVVMDEDLADDGACSLQSWRRRKCADG